MSFNKLVSFQLEYAPQYHVTKYVSSRTKLQLVHINHQSSPLVQGYFAVATECANDSGAPHTLEHLIFMGSKKYPYKGLLDTAGNLCMSSTNAWTGTDQTVYTLTTAGWKGFKKLLPVYLDHVLFPTLTDEACVTEVYHVDPDTLTDKGVVYSEMEAIESQSWFVTMFEKQRLLHAPGSGYRSETGGLTENLRTLTNDEIRKFHSDMYSSDNLCVIICGNVPEKELLEVMESWDASLPRVDHSNARKRPFVDSKASQIPTKLTERVEATVEFPETDESQGEILIAFIGKLFDDYENDLAVSMLMDYFTETALAPFNKLLVEIEEPYANSIDYWTDDFTRTIINIGVHGVPTELLDVTKDKVLETMRTHKVDLERMKQVIDNAKWDYVLKCEKNGDNVLSQIVIADFLYGDDKGNLLKMAMETLNDYETLMEWTLEKWQSLLDEIFVKNEPVIVLGVPSKDLYERFETKQDELTKKRKALYKDENRKKLNDKLRNAKAHNDKPIPEDLLKSFAIEDPLNSVSFIKTNGYTNNDDFKKQNNESEIAKHLVKSKPADFPFFIHAEHFPSQFVEIHTLLNSRNIEETSLLPYYHVLDELFSMPMITENGTLLTYEQVVTKLKQETVDSNIALGLQGSSTDLIDVRIRAKAENYSDAVKWIKFCLYDMVFDEKRVAILLENYMNSIVELKREGDVMLESLINRKIHLDKAMRKAVDPIQVQSIIENILDDIEDGKFEKVILPKLESMRRQLRNDFESFHILIMGDIAKIGDQLYEPWKFLVEKYDVKNKETGIKIPPVPLPLDALATISKVPRDRAYIVSTPASESSYMSLMTSIPFNMNYRDSDYPIVSLASEYLQCVEGPFWKGIRGAGLAYGASMVNKSELNMWEFSIYRGADIVKCFEAGNKIVEDYASGAAEFEPHLIQGALSSIINRIATMENGYFATGLSRFVDEFLKKRGTDFNEYYLARLSEVTIEDLRRVTKKYLVHLFNPEKSIAFVSCHPTKTESVKEFLIKKGYTVEVEEIEEDSEEEDDSDKEENDD